MCARGRRHGCSDIEEHTPPSSSQVRAHADDQFIGESALFPLSTALDRRTHEVLLPLFPSPPELHRCRSWRDAVETWTAVLIRHVPLLDELLSERLPSLGHRLGFGQTSTRPGQSPRWHRTNSPKKNSVGGLGVLKVSFTLTDR